MAKSKLVYYLLNKNLKDENIKNFNMGISLIKKNGNELQLIKDKYFIEIFKELELT